MLLRATENTVAGHIWLAGHYLPTPGLYSKALKLQFPKKMVKDIIKQSKEMD